jgi:hypothetical protein
VECGASGGRLVHCIYHDTYYTQGDRAGTKRRAGCGGRRRTEYADSADHLGTNPPLPSIVTLSFIPVLTRPNTYMHSSHNEMQRKQGGIGSPYTHYGTEGTKVEHGASVCQCPLLYAHPTPPPRRPRASFTRHPSVCTAVRRPLAHSVFRGQVLHYKRRAFFGRPPQTNGPADPITR